ncbi:MAG: disulfide bond formation protein B [Chlamydiales bacterium]|nr:disulfide bond formation protein B [Chlamydiales bacterium]
MVNIQKNCNALIVIIISLILLGAYGVQFLAHEQPCPLCMLQRLAMLSVAAACLCNIRFGIHMSHYAVVLLSSFVGGLVALRQISLHVCPGFSPSFGMPVFGLSLYTWSFVVFVCCIVAVAFLLFIYDPRENPQVNAPLNALAKWSFFLIFVICLANIITTYLQCGFGACNE